MNPLTRATEAYEQHQVRMQLEGGYLARELALDVASYEEIQAALPEDTTLIEYGLSDDGSYVFIITSDAIDGYVLDVDYSEVVTLLRTFTSDRQANEATLRDLYDLIFAPIAGQISSSHLIIVADDILNYVPFAALQAPDGSYLIDQHAISMVPSGSVLSILEEREAATSPSTPSIALSQPVADGLSTLSNANSEATNVAQELGITAITNATETDLRVSSTGAAIVHISAHVGLNPFTPLTSAIYLGADNAHDGRFEIREIYELDLS